jgi:hypothetical protein
MFGLLNQFEMIGCFHYDIVFADARGQEYAKREKGSEEKRT